MTNKKWQNFPTPHCHVLSFDSASTPESFVRREIELETGTVTVTDHGTMAACRRVYDLAKSKNLTPILGLEAYFRDDNCPILKKFGIEDSKGYLKYYHLTIHCLDEAAFQVLSRKLSNARVERHGSEAKPLFDWADLEEIGAQNVTITSGCLVGMVQRHILAHGRLDIAVAYYEKLKSLTKTGNFYVEIFPHCCDKNWVAGVFVDLKNGDKLKFWDSKKLQFRKAGEMTAIDVVKAFATKRWDPQDELIAVMNNRKWHDLTPEVVTNVQKIEEFMPNECTSWAPDGDVQRGCNRVMMALVERYGDKILISDDSHFATPDEKVVQDIRLQQMGNWRFYGSYHRKTSEEAYENLRQLPGVTEKLYEQWLDNNREWAGKFKDFKFDSKPSLPTKFYPQDTLNHTISLIRKHGRMQWDNQTYLQRLDTELKLLHQNGTIDLLPYFMVGEEVCSLYEERGMLTGPGRGSAAGLLLTYLLGITHVDPIRYGLSLERFITLDRIKSGRLPDIDQDLPTRDPLVDSETGWLKERFGDHYAQISVDTTLKLRSSAKDVARALLGRVPEEIELLTKRFVNAPQGVSDRDFVFGYEDSGEWKRGSIETDLALQEYIAKYPKHWAIVQKTLGLQRQPSRHPCAFVLANRPISDFIPLTEISGHRVTQYTAPSVESAGGIKMDFLVVNSLQDVQACIKLVQQRSGLEIPKEVVINNRRVPSIRLVPKNGQLHDIWDLPEDLKVFAEIAEGKTETVFQFNTASAKQWLKHFNFWKTEEKEAKAIDSVDAMAAFTALDRPGPLDAYVEDKETGTKHNMLVEYARRARGEEAIGSMPVFTELFPETHGILTFQEQLQRIYQELTGCTGAEAEEFRSNIAKKKMDKVLKAYEPFLERAGQKLGSTDIAKTVWDTLVTWGQYGFCKSVHSETLLKTSNGFKKLCDIKPGEQILAINSEGQPFSDTVVALHDHGKMNGWEVEFDDGYKVTASLNHKFLTKEGQKPLHTILERKMGVLCLPSGGSASNGEQEPDLDPALGYLIPKLAHEEAGAVSHSNAPLASTGDLVLRTVVRVRSVGVVRMYDLEVAGDKHNYCLPNGVVTSNSHAVCYSVIGYACAYLKHHFPLEWWCAVLRNADKNEINQEFWVHCGHLIDFPDVNLSGDQFEIAGDRIRAPISMLMGVGDSAHQQILKYRPYKNIEDMCEKIEAHCVNNATPVLDAEGNQVYNKKVKKGKEELTPKVRRAHNAITRGIMYKLIVAGSLDSLFQAEDNGQPPHILDKLRAYETAMAKVKKKRTVPAIPDTYLYCDAALQYQLRKEVLPAYSAEILPILVDLGHEKIKMAKDNNRKAFAYYDDGKSRIPFVTADALKAMAALTPFPEGQRLQVAVAAYVLNQRVFTYKENKTAVELELDIDGHRLAIVKWPDKKGLPDFIKADMAGALVTVVMAKFAENKPLVLDEVTIIRQARSKEQKEESPNDE